MGIRPGDAAECALPPPLCLVDVRRENGGVARRCYKCQRVEEAPEQGFGHGGDDSARATAGARSVTHGLLRRRSNASPNSGRGRTAGGAREDLCEPAGAGRPLPEVHPELGGGGSARRRHVASWPLILMAALGAPKGNPQVQKSAGLHLIFLEFFFTLKQYILFQTCRKGTAIPLPLAFNCLSSGAQEVREGN